MEFREAMCVYKVYLVELAKLRRKKEDRYRMVYVMFIYYCYSPNISVFFLLQGWTGLFGPLVVGWHYRSMNWE